MTTAKQQHIYYILTFKLIFFFLQMIDKTKSLVLCNLDEKSSWATDIKTAIK